MRQLDIRYNQIYTVRDELRDEMAQRNIRLAGDMREEFARAITKEVEFESKTSAQLVQTVNDELTNLITRSNECHSYRYFGLVEDVKQVRENADTLKKSIGMVDAELSDVKETVEQLTDEVGQNTTDVSNVQVALDDLKEDVYYELDRDYHDLKLYMKQTNRRHEKKYHHRPQDDQTTNAVQLIADEYAEQEEQQQPQPPEKQERQNEIFIIIDDDTFVSEDDNDVVIQRPQV
jgi:chromosome segregation ATPase